MPVTNVKSGWSSGNLVFFEGAIGRSVTGDVLTVGTGAVQVGGTGQDVDLQFYGTGSLSAIIDCGAATLTLVGIAQTTDKAITSSGATSGIGYATGAGGAVTQQTNKGTGVALSKICGEITMHNAQLAAATSVGFTVTNTAVTANDVVVASIASVATVASYTLTVDAVAAGSFKLSLRNETAGGLSEAVVINFVVIKGVKA